ncbi:hypothetical protein SETIT_8G044200v2 [Setaria italica]|uniref:Uncharacterized protein n=1 Tax=Setaria italica TaxID=4555 RepID=A0A368S4E2_SETIT|nr:uncharacterized protein LOC101783191 [Setaria italica]RCV37204.1 hypothetical protein SETIT_8G044200v2 [Setaria italica]
MGSSSLCAFQAMVTTAASSAGAAPFALRRRGNCFVPPPQRGRPRAAQWQGRPRGTDPQASPPLPVEGRGPTKLLPGTAVRVGAGVALAIALGGVSWSWTTAARGGSACPVLQPPPLVSVLNDATAGGATMDKRLLRDYIDKLSNSLRNKRYRDKLRRNGDKLMRELKQQFSETNKVDQGVQLTESWILVENWEEAEATCQKLTSLHPQDPRPRLLSIVINVTRAMEALLSTEPTTTDNDIEEMASKINKMTKNAIDAWKEYRKDTRL